MISNSGTGLRLLDRDRHPLDAVEEVRAQPLDRPRELDLANPRNELLERDLDLEPGQVGAEAEVDAAGAEGHVQVRVAADVEAVGVVEDLLVAVPGGEPGGDLVALADRLAAEREIACRGPPEVVHGSRPAQDLLARRPVKARIGAQAL